MSATIQLIQISVEELQNLILDGVKVQLDELKNSFEPKSSNEYLTRREVADLLKINLTTIHVWSKKGILKPHYIGRRVYFLRKSIDESITQLQK